MIILICKAAKTDRKVTYSLYPYLPDVEYCTEVLEDEWGKLHPDIELEFVPFNCYSGGKPEGIDVIMYDTILEREFIEDGYLKPLNISDFIDIEDFYEFTLEPAAGYDDRYGVPVFLCCDCMIYDSDNKDLSAADDIFDVTGSDSHLLISMSPYGDDFYLLDAAVDIAQDAEVIQFKNKIVHIDVSESKKALADAAIPEYMDTESNDLAGLYDSGVADGYVGYAETMRFLDKRIDSTDIKQISIAKNGNIPLFYCDMVGISTDVPDEQTGLCMDLIKILTDTEVMKRVSVKDGAPQYLMFPRSSFYDVMEKEYPMYAKLRTVVENESNKLFRAYETLMDERNGR